MVKCNTTRDSAYSSFGLAPTASLFSSLFMDCLLYHRQSRGSNSFASRASRSLVLSFSRLPFLPFCLFLLISSCPSCPSFPSSLPSQLLPSSLTFIFLSRGIYLHLTSYLPSLPHFLSFAKLTLRRIADILITVLRSKSHRLLLRCLSLSNSTDRILAQLLVYRFTQFIV